MAFTTERMDDFTLNPPEKQQEQDKPHNDPAEETEAALIARQLEELTATVKGLTQKMETLEAIKAKPRGDADLKSIETAIADIRSAQEELSEQMPLIINTTASAVRQAAAQSSTPRGSCGDGGIIKGAAGVALMGLILSNLLVFMPYTAYSLFRGDTYRRIETIRYNTIHPNGDAYLTPDGQVLKTDKIIYYVPSNPSPDSIEQVKKTQNEIDYKRAVDLQNAAKQAQ